MKAKKKYPSGIESIERRTVACELRVDGSDQGTTIQGYAAVFNKLSEPMGFDGFREMVMPGAFTRTLKGDADVRALVDHDPARIIGRRKAGTLELRQDDVGLKVRIRPPDTSAGRDIVESIRRGDIDQMSFAFSVNGREGEGWDDDDKVRELRDLDLFDVSPVTFAAYPDTTVAVRSLERFHSNAKIHRWIEQQRQVMDSIRNGC